MCFHKIKLFIRRGLEFNEVKFGKINFKPQEMDNLLEEKRLKTNWKRFELKVKFYKCSQSSNSKMQLLKFQFILMDEQNVQTDQCHSFSQYYTKVFISS